MGLDQYLYAKYVDGPTLEEYEQAMDKAAWPEGTEGHFDLEAYQAAKTAARVEVAYWRKANQIHAYFVDNFQGGVDECQLSEPISKEALAGLVEKCRRILLDSRLAAELLPPREGFFFGTYEVDEWYMRDLEDTVKQLTPLLTTPDIDHFIYQSSW